MPNPRISHSDIQNDEFGGFCVWPGGAGGTLRGVPRSGGAFRVQGKRGEQDGPTGHQYLKRQIWSVGAKNKTHGVSSHAGSFPGLESRF